MPEKKNVGLVAFLLLASVLTATSVANLVPHSTALESGPCTVTLPATTNNSTAVQTIGPQNTTSTLSSGAVPITVTAAGSSVYLNPYAINATLTVNGTYTVNVSGHNVYITWTPAGLGLNFTQTSNTGDTMTRTTTDSSTTLNATATSSTTLPACGTLSMTSANSSNR